MERDQGDDRSSYEQPNDQKQLKAKLHAVIQNCFPASNFQQLHKWHKEYKAVPANQLTSQHVVIQEIQADELDRDAVEQCITELAADISVESRFCSDCQHLFDHWPDLGDPEVKDPCTEKNWPGSGADWKHTVARECHTLLLEAAARKGCRFCAFLVQMIRDARLLEIIRKIEVRLLQCLDEKGTASLSVQNWGQNTEQLLWVNYPGKVCDHCNCGIAQEIKFDSQAMEPSTDAYERDRDVLDIAKEWMDECCKNHKDCNKKDENALPTRLISIAGDDLRLVFTARWQTKPHYSTLSHRWGDESFLTLTEQNHDAFLKAIPNEELPKTFKDAVHISQRLGLDYLWIDSLCIVQGDVEDWRREAALMSSVYGGSFINIAASSAVNVHEGCFLKESYLVDGLRARISVGGNNLVREFRSLSVYELSITESHLATRAWAVQEKILPPRTIHFGNRGAFWECRSKIANEFLPGGFRSWHSGLIDEDVRKDFDHYWWNIVRLYSAANLTYSQDKLPALSGIARRIHEEKGGQYIAGMWRDEDIEGQLCWRAMTSRVRPPPRAPSWSWASIDGKVFNCERRWSVSLRDSYAHVLDVKMTLLGQGAFGEVRNGCMRIACSGMVAARFSGQNTVKIESDDTNNTADDDYPVSKDVLDDGWEKDSDSSVYLLPLFGGETGAGSYADKKEEDFIKEIAISGLVLRKEGAVTGQFCRIGMFEFLKDSVNRSGRPEDKPKEHLESFLEAFKQIGRSVAGKVCAEVVENAKYPEEGFVISVV